MAKSLWDKFMESLTEEEKAIWERWEEATQETPDELSKDERRAAASGGITSDYASSRSISLILFPPRGPQGKSFSILLAEPQQRNI